MDTTIRPAVAAELLTTEDLKRLWFDSEPINFGDPVLARTEFPFRRAFFPLGFPVIVSTNVPEVLEAANKSWGGFTQIVNLEAISINVGVTPSDSDLCPPTPKCRMRGHLITNIADGENFVVCDLSTRGAMMWVTESALRHESYFRYFFLESAAMASISNLHTTAIHAGCVALEGKGVLLCGDSGAGKSTLSYACARAGWTFTTDDASYLVHGGESNLVAGNCHQVRFRPSAQVLFHELDGLSVMKRAGVGKPSIELSTNLHIKTSVTSQVKHIVFLKRGVREQELTVFPRAVARLLMHQTVYCTPYKTDAKLSAIDRLLECEVHELRYNDLEWAVAQLTTLASKVNE